ncbi:hypothetical protein OHS18_20340 [Amycolatopsis sp. NBC_00355]|uniref:hypothetical protein n=1 Tax=Amycolatopsis sp. NBC_00355 TaxID=2975957 RepID=UPI002E26D176
MPVETPTRQVRVRLPKSWLEIDPRAEDLTAELIRTAREHHGDDVDEDLIGRLAGPLALELRRLTTSVDLILAGFFAEIVDTGSPQPMLITANVAIALSPPVGGLEQVRRQIEHDARDTDAEITTRELPAGLAVSTAGHIEVSHPGWSDTVPAFTRRFYLPVPGLHRVAALTFVTPNLDLADEFDEVFAAIAGTLSFSG